MAKTRTVCAALAIGVATIGAIGCSSEVAAEDDDDARSTEQAAVGAACGDYPKNPACNEKLFVVRAWELANEDPKANFVEPIMAAKDCLEGLVAGGAVLAGTGAAAPVILSTAGAKKIIETFFACKDVAEYFGRIGLPANVSCWLQPKLPDAKVQTCKCAADCRGGVYNTGGPFGERLKTLTKFRYGYMDRAESNWCYCTNEAKEAKCRLRCGKWSSKDPNDCGCSAPP